MNGGRDALVDVARVFEQAGIPYAVIGAHAVNVWLEPSNATSGLIHGQWPSRILPTICSQR